jgi:hypothetical protein
MQVLHTVRSSASSFNFQYLLFSLRSSSSCLRLPRLPVTYILPSNFLSITCFTTFFLFQLCHPRNNTSILSERQEHDVCFLPLIFCLLYPENNLTVVPVYPDIQNVLSLSDETKDNGIMKTSRRTKLQCKSPGACINHTARQ